MRGLPWRVTSSSSPAAARSIQSPRRLRNAFEPIVVTPSTEEWS
jgi:hypothetical protein